MFTTLPWRIMGSLTSWKKVVYLVANNTFSSQLFAHQDVLKCVRILKIFSNSLWLFTGWIHFCRWFEHIRWGLFLFDLADRFSLFSVLHMSTVSPRKGDFFARQVVNDVDIVVIHCVNWKTLFQQQAAYSMSYFQSVNGGEDSQR